MAARTAADGKRVRRTAQTAADGVGATEWLEIMGAEKKPLVMSELGCADGCGRQMGGENCADGVGAREWLEIGGEKKPLEISQLGCADGCGREMGAENCADGCGRRGKWARRRSRWRSASVAARTAADGVGATEWLEMGGEKKPLEISELGCADGCGREMGAENCADGCGRRGCNGVAGNGWREDAAGDERAWLRGGCGRQMGAENCADGCGRRGGWKWVGNRSRW